MNQRPCLLVTNFNRHFTGVSATAAAVLRTQARHWPVALVGHPLPGCPQPISLTMALKLSRVAPQDKPCVIWHVRRNMEMQAALLARDVLGLPVKIVFTSSAQRRHSRWPRWLISRMDGVIATTVEAAALVPQVLAVAPHGVDTETFYPASDRAAAWQASGFPGTRGIATIGRLRPEKGTDLFVRTMLRVLPHCPGVTALLIGRVAPEHQGFLRQLQQEIAAAGMEDRILFPGEVPADKLPALVRGLALLVALPRYEGYGLTPLEAMASGVPVVASRAGHFQAFLGDGLAGYVVAQEDVESAGEHVLRLLADAALHERLSRQARARAVERFSVEQEAAIIGRVYDQLWHAGVPR